MKILFSNPPWWQMHDSSPRKGIRAGSRWPFTMHAPHAPDDFRFGGYLPFPFFLAHAAAWTSRELPDASVILRDSIARGESYDTFFAYIASEHPDFIVIETATPSWSHDESILARIAKVSPHSKIILTGTLPCEKAAEICAKNVNVIAIAQGEFDKQIVAIIRAYGAPAPFDRRIWPHNLLTPDELNASPFPLFDPACEGRYWDACPSGQQSPHLQIWTSRGCPHKCIFCVWPAVMTGNDPDGTRSRRVRCHSPEWVEQMIRARLAAATAHGVEYRSIYIDDDTFNLTDRHTLSICAVMKRIGLPWSAMCRVDSVSHSTWRVMRESECFGVKLGFESGSQHVIDHIVNKRLDLAKAENETLPYLQSLGLTVHTTWTIGLPGETAVQQNETLRAIKRFYAKGLHQTHQLSGTAEIEGTPLHTLRTTERLAKYDGATIDGFDGSADGQKKIERMQSR